MEFIGASLVARQLSGVCPRSKIGAALNRMNRKLRSESYDAPKGKVKGFQNVNI